MQEKWIKVFTPKEGNIKEIRFWINENIKGRFHFKPSNFDSLIGWYGDPFIKFEDPADALAFKLVWAK